MRIRFRPKEDRYVEDRHGLGIWGLVSTVALFAEGHWPMRNPLGMRVDVSGEPSSPRRMDLQHDGHWWHDIRWSQAKNLSAIAGAVLSSVLRLGAQPSPVKNGDAAWKLEFLLGKWTASAGEKDTPLGAGQLLARGELNHKVIVRHNRVDHDTALRGAIYSDSERHVIRYNLTFPLLNGCSLRVGQHRHPRKYNVFLTSLYEICNAAQSRTC